MTPSPTNLLFVDPNLIFVDKSTRQRKEMGDIDALANSIKEWGQLQPILVHTDDEGRLSLVAGERRLEACKKLGINILAVVNEANDEAEFYEFEENFRRKDITWQERTMAVAALHKTSLRTSSLKGERWLPMYTGTLCGLSQASVYHALRIAEQLQKGDEEVAKCSGVNEALQILAKRAERKATQMLVSSSTPLAGTSSEKDEPPTTTVEFNAPKRPRRKLDIIHSDAIKWMEKQPDSSIHCIYCDPPYAIEMDNIQQDGGGMNVDDVRATHQVRENLDLLQSFITESARCLIPANGFLAMWCDFWFFRDLARIAEAAGLNVQRWPFVWVKTSRCQNMAAAYNFTKNIEACLIARTHKSMLVAPQLDCSYIGENLKPDWISNPFWKPLELHQRILSAIATPGTRIIDPFGGCGSIGLAATEAHWDCTMIEKDITHINVLRAYLKGGTSE